MMKTHCLLMLLAAILIVITPVAQAAVSPIAIGSRLELFVDDYLIESLNGARLQLHRPVPCEVAILHNEPWEGGGCCYMTVFQDGDIYRMYYRGAHGVYKQGKYETLHPEVTCYAESKDGIRWTKPALGIFEFNRSKQNNIVMTNEVGGGATHNFCPFLDTRPGVPAGQRYKALGGGGSGLLAFISADGIHWQKLSEKPILTKGAFDSQNLAFWDPLKAEYRAYYRDFRDGRDIKLSFSKDFLTWTEPIWLDYRPGRISELYTNQIIPYHRAPHIYLGFPTRYIDRGWSDSMKALPQPDYRQVRASVEQREGTALTDGMFMASRDGRTFSVWPESFIRPGLRLKGHWFYGDNYQNWGLVETRSVQPDTPNEISIYVNENAAQGEPCLHRRYCLRIDGFVSVTAPLSGGELLCKPIVFDGSNLVLNFSTSAVGSIRVEIQDAIGKPMAGYSLVDCPDIFGDTHERVVSWSKGNSIKHLSGQTVRLRFVLRDADLFSFRFR